jgi:hypothetical protein
MFILSCRGDSRDLGAASGALKRPSEATCAGCEGNEGFRFFAFGPFSHYLSQVNRISPLDLQNRKIIFSGLLMSRRLAGPRGR